MRLEWGDAKNRRNLSKPKISFETAKSVFDDPHQVSVQDRVVGTEERWQTLGMVSGVVVIVAHTWEEADSGQVMRLISARKATAREREVYAENKQQSS
jgi:uncharacterized DUF497 family protein